jgi:hypothetical protein
VSAVVYLLIEIFLCWKSFMPRRPRAHFPGALYHVISQGNQRQKIYQDDVDQRRFETLLGE